jgi:hypothetical protein
MITHEYKEQEGSIHIFGERSKVANWIVSHILLVAIILTCFFILLFLDEGEVMLKRSLTTIPPAFFVPAILVRILLRNRCFRVEIDKKAEKIRFLRFFHKEIVEANLRSVDFIFDNHFACYFDGQRFTIFNEYMGGIADILPPGMGINFSKGFYGRFMKKQMERNRR